MVSPHFTHGKSIAGKSVVPSKLEAGLRLSFSSLTVVTTQYFLLLVSEIIRATQ